MTHQNQHQEVAQKLIAAYQGPEPLAAHLKKYFAANSDGLNISTENLRGAAANSRRKRELSVVPSKLAKLCKSVNCLNRNEPPPPVIQKKNSKVVVAQKSGRVVNK